MRAILENPWLAVIAVGITNILLLLAFSRKKHFEKPEWAIEYRKLVVRFGAALLLPCAVGAIGLHFNFVDEFQDYQRLLDMKPFVVGFWAIVVALLVALNWWTIFGNGAGMLINHPVFCPLGIQEEIVIKQLYLVGSILFLMVNLLVAIAYRYWGL